MPISPGLIVRLGSRPNHSLFILRHELRRARFDRDPDQLAGEAERNLVVGIVYTATRVQTDIKGLVIRKNERNGMGNRPCRHLRAVHLENASAAFGRTRAVISKVE